jgi:hypothetical protein
MQKTVRLMNTVFDERRTCHISSIKDMGRLSNSYEIPQKWYVWLKCHWCYLFNI